MEESEMRRRLDDRMRQDAMLRGRRTARSFGVGFALWFAFCALVGLGMLGLVAWAIIKLVTWVTTQ